MLPINFWTFWWKPCDSYSQLQNDGALNALRFFSTTLYYSLNERRNMQSDTVTTCHNSEHCQVSKLRVMRGFCSMLRTAEIAEQSSAVVPMVAMLLQLHDL